MAKAPKMKRKYKKYLCDVISREGFQYTFEHYSSFQDEVKDEHFHKLRKAYLKAADELAEYILDVKYHQRNWDE